MLKEEQRNALEEVAGNVEAWLEEKGVKLDVSWPADATVHDVLEQTLQEVTKLRQENFSAWTKKWSNKDGQTVSMRQFGHNGCKTIMSTTSLNTTQEEFGVFANDKRMFDVAKIWDATFKTAETIAELPLGSKESPPHASTARIVRWQLNASPLWPREILYVIIPINNGFGGTCYAYAGLQGLPTSPGFVKARLQAPSFDDVAPENKEDSSKLSLLHAFTCELGLPGFVQRWVIDPAAAKHAREEAVEIVGLFTSEAFRSISGSPTSTK
mmetsp:Transcript_13640/g.26347  ORF Transcript_13640/g.26347 Transcript_13640/m.26347 type:complete len:269 (+) Transcript_13640:279-1085(+)|eukprot:CAMPEP_0171518332 /NCGR_PEP_ID=MMETSP0959-20130129/5212_1 /TAXON_ID=87120 /ORGANISM="Aurantiochytrium limacinum, Strain ATCCMYA-1381" /LENGTH=268 /DNA_ID=CAMNT_0012057499 /DNA_START=181 /DNA_END=987 /DNA_ORIENTATION=-